MRIVTLNFKSPDRFLAHYTEAGDTGALHCVAGVELCASEEAIADLWFPGLPSRTLLRGSVLGDDEDDGDGTLLLIDERDHATRDFVVGVARGSTHQASPRAHARLPIVAPVVVRCDPTSRMSTEIVSTTIDISAGGLCVDCEIPPPPGTAVRVILGPVAGEALVLYGNVAWCRREDGHGAFGIGLDDRGLDGDMRRLGALVGGVFNRGRLPSEPLH